MNRREWMTAAFGWTAATLISRRLPAQQSAAGNTGSLEKSEGEWRRILTPEEFRVLRQAGTERRYTSALNDEKRNGLFLCAGCFLPLFSSETKYDSGTGWPSFWDCLEGRVETSVDYKIGYARTEYHCSRCGGHQGHIFEDGPRPTGLRYCNNGVALTFAPEGDELPALRT